MERVKLCVLNIPAKIKTIEGDLDISFKNIEQRDVKGLERRGEFLLLLLK